MFGSKQPSEMINTQGKYNDILFHKNSLLQ